MAPWPRPAHHRVQLVDKEDDLALARWISSSVGLEPLLELAAEARAGHHRAQVQRNDALAHQRLRHIVG
jgi:hypothetical protein